MIEIEGLRIRPAESSDDLVSIARLRFHAGRTHVILGRSGAGKSLLAKAASGMAMAGFQVDGVLNAVNSLSLHLADNRTELLKRVFLLPQEPSLMLDPTMQIGHQIKDVLRWRKSSVAPFDDLGSLAGSVGLLREDMRRYPHECSGGMLQRALIAMALVARADIVICDEPTKGLDDQRCMDVTRRLAGLRGQGRALVIITHDLRLTRQLGDDLAVIERGRVAENGEVRKLLAQPQSPALRSILAAEPDHWRTYAHPPSGGRRPLINLQNIGQRTMQRYSLWHRRNVRDHWLFRNTNLTLYAGEIVGLCGASGVGKSTLCDIALGIRRPAEGSVWWQGSRLDLLSRQARRKLRPAFVKLFQDPASSLSSGLSGETILRRLTPQQNKACLGETGLHELLDRLHLDRSVLFRTPSTMSGGEKQRLAIARVILAKPRFIVCDEPSSRLDMVIQKDAVELLVTEALRIGAAMLFVSHDRRILDRVANRTFELQPTSGLSLLPTVEVAQKVPEAILMK